MIRIERLDHLVLTVQSIDQTISFYGNVLGMQASTFGQHRWALHFGDQKINLHQTDQEILPRAKNPTSGSADLCFISATPLAEIVAHLQTQSIPIEQGPVQRTGAKGSIISVYIRDPDQNLIEISNYS